MQKEVGNTGLQITKELAWCKRA